MVGPYSIRAVAEKTGVSVHTLRAWERRYQVLSPDRTEANQRRYTDQDVRRIRLIVGAVSKGQSIASASQLSNEDLEEFLSGADRRPGESASDFIALCQSAMIDYDAETFQTAVRRACAILGVESFLLSVALPLLEDVGARWKAGEICIAQEHFASSNLRSEFERLRYSFIPTPNAPRIVISTPSGHIHELGALAAAITSAMHGWRVTYLGPNLPAAEISATARHIRAIAVAISVVHPKADDRTIGEFRRLRDQLGTGYPILVGGGGADSYIDVLKEIDARVLGDLASIREELAKLAPYPSPAEAWETRARTPSSFE